MSDSIHGHEVMELMIQNDQGFTKASLKQTIEQAFGKQARFHTCSKQGMNSAEIIDCLEAKGKFVGTADNFNTHKTKICNH